MPDLSVVKVSRSSGKGQIEISGKRRGKMNGKDKKSELLRRQEKRGGKTARAVEISTASVPFRHTIVRLMQNRLAFENPKPPVSSKFIQFADGTIPATGTAAVAKKPGFRASPEKQ